MFAIGSALFLVVNILFLFSMGFYLFGVDKGAVTSRESRLRTKEKSFWVWLSVYSVVYVAVVYLLYLSLIHI